MKIIFTFLFISINIFSQDSLFIQQDSVLYPLDLIKPVDSASVYQETLSDRGIGETIVDDAVIIGEDAASFFTAPLRFSATDWLIAGGVAGATIGLIALDEQAQNAFARKDAGTLNKDFWDIPTSFGIIAYANIFSFGFYAAGLVADDDWTRITGRLLIESLFLSGVTVMGARFIAGRVRPYYNEGAYRFKGFQASNEFQSFPSGHTTVAWALSTVLAERIDNIFARVGFYGIAAMTGYARVRNNQHWISDVAVGALLGFGSGFYVVHKEHERERGEETFLTIVPSFNGINLIYNF